MARDKAADGLANQKPGSCCMAGQLEGTRLRAFDDGDAFAAPMTRVTVGANTPGFSTKHQVRKVYGSRDISVLILNLSGWRCADIPGR